MAEPDDATLDAVFDRLVREISEPVAEVAAPSGKETGVGDAPARVIANARRLIRELEGSAAHWLRQIAEH